MFALLQIHIATNDLAVSWQFCSSKFGIKNILLPRPKICFALQVEFGVDASVAEEFLVEFDSDVKATLFKQNTRFTIQG